MTVTIHIGDKGKTIGPLNPTGRVTVIGCTLDASSEGGWIDTDSDIVIIGGNTRRAIVGEWISDVSLPENKREPLPDEKSVEPTPLRSPPTWVERINPVITGDIIGLVLIPTAWLTGTPFSLYAVLMPASGATAGWFFLCLLELPFNPQAHVRIIGPKQLRLRCSFCRGAFLVLSLR